MFNLLIAELFKIVILKARTSLIIIHNNCVYIEILNILGEENLTKTFQNKISLLYVPSEEEKTL